MAAREGRACGLWDVSSLSSSFTHKTLQRPPHAYAAGAEGCRGRRGRSEGWAWAWGVTGSAVATGRRAGDVRRERGGGWRDMRFSPLSTTSSHDDASSSVNFEDDNTMNTNEELDALASSRRTAIVRGLALSLFALIAFVIVILSTSIGDGNAHLSLYNGILRTMVDRKEGSISIQLEERNWITALPHAFVRRNNKMLSTEDGSLVLASVVGGGSSSIGTDPLGEYAKTVLSFAAAGEHETILTCTVKAYASTLILEQSFPIGLRGTSAGSPDSLVSAWPVLRPNTGPSSRLHGYAHWVSWWYKSDNTPERRELLVAPGFTSPQVGRFTSTTSLRGGLGGTGVIALFDDRARETIVVSAFEGAMDMNALALAPGTIAWGLQGNLSSVAAGSKVSIILQASKSGVNAAMTQWGRQLLKRSAASKSTQEETDGSALSAARLRDYTLSWLGYTTDNGMYYYYHTAPGRNYQQTLVSLVQSLREAAVPIKYLQLDSWWYHHSKVNDGVKNWTTAAKADILPDGLAGLYQETGLPFQLHNRYWAPDTDYAVENGGDYNFLIDKGSKGAVPSDPHFWPDLFRTHKTAGLIVYEQDWLFNELWLAGSYLLSQMGASAKWLDEMASAAEQEGVSIQYCMPYVRHILQSVHYPAVTQARASDDYVLSPSSVVRQNWRIGGQAILLDSLGLAVSKDGFFTTSRQPGNPYGEERFEPFPRLQSAVVTLSAGPVAIGDGIGFTDRDLVLRSCGQDGRLLQSSTAARTIDLMFALQVSSGGDDGSINPYAGSEVWLALAYIHGVPQAGHLFASLDSDLIDALGQPIVVWPSDLTGLLPEAGQESTSTTDSFWAVEAKSTEDVQKLDSTNGLCLTCRKQHSLDEFAVWTIVPIQANGWALLGETDKWVRISPARISYIQSTSGDGGSIEGLSVGVRGAVGERIVLEFVSPAGKIVRREAVLGASGEAVIASSD